MLFTPRSSNSCSPASRQDSVTSWPGSGDIVTAPVGASCQGLRPMRKPVLQVPDSERGLDAVRMVDLRDDACRTRKKRFHGHGGSHFPLTGKSSGTICDCLHLIPVAVNDESGVVVSAVVRPGPGRAVVCSTSSKRLRVKGMN